MKINVKAFALTVGLFWGFGLLFITWWIILFEGASGDVTLIGRCTEVIVLVLAAVSSGLPGHFLTELLAVPFLPGFTIFFRQR